MLWKLTTVQAHVKRSSTNMAEGAARAKTDMGTRWAYLKNCRGAGWLWGCRQICDPLEDLVMDSWHRA